MAIQSMKYKQCLEDMRIDILNEEGFGAPHVVPNVGIKFDYYCETGETFLILCNYDGSYHIYQGPEMVHYGKWIDYVDVEECEFETFYDHLDEHFEEFFETGSFPFTDDE